VARNRSPMLGTGILKGFLKGFYSLAKTCVCVYNVQVSEEQCGKSYVRSCVVLAHKQLLT